VAAVDEGHRGHRVVGAAELERAGALQVLALEEQRGARARVGGARRDDGRAVRDAFQALRGRFDIGEGRELNDASIVASIAAAPLRS